MCGLVSILLCQNFLDGVPETLALALPIAPRIRCGAPARVSVALAVPPPSQVVSKRIPVHSSGTEGVWLGMLHSGLRFCCFLSFGTRSMLHTIRDHTRSFSRWLQSHCLTVKVLATICQYGCIPGRVTIQHLASAVAPRIY